MELKQKKKYYFTYTKHDCTSAQCICNWNTFVLATNKRQSAFASANLCQGQLQISQSTTVPSSVSYDIPSDLVHNFFGIMMKK